MTEMQSKLLEMFVWFHNFCKDNDLTYYAVGGTVLGAIRHQGFIPWDDDMDVGMPRPDYEKLRELSKKKAYSSKYEFEFPGEKKDYVYPFCKIYDKTTTLIDNNKRHDVKRGIYIDIFPLDGGGATKNEAIQQCRSLKRDMNFHWALVCPMKKERGLCKNFAILTARCILGVVFSVPKIIDKMERKCKKFSFQDSKYIVNFLGVWKDKEIMEWEWFGKPTLKKFEEKEIYCPEDCASYLSQLYGDYMTLPPEEKRRSVHGNIHIDLNKSYLD